MSCSACGRAIAKGDTFCPGCGTPVVEQVTTATGQPPEDVGTNSTQCVKCASPMGSSDQFCPKCGASRPEPATVMSHVSLRNAQAAHLIDATRDEFEIIRQLGHGAMGAVYLAKDTSLDRMVAIKVIAPNLLADETMISRFRLEAQTVASLRHPNIVSVHAVRQSDDLYYFVMEFIDGPPLRSMIRGHAPLEASVVQGLVFQVGTALSYAHRTSGGVIHRDIKPANIMIDREGNAFVTDFGISKIAESQAGLTQTGATIGTPEYMSPEQCRGEQLTGSSDQYALGIMAYEMLCGQTPFSGSQYHIMVAHTSEHPKPIRETNPGCPAHLAEAVERMLAKTPEERWPDLDSAVGAMGGAPMGYQDPVRTKIIALTGSTLAHVPALDAESPTSPGGGGASSTDSATSVTVTGLPSVVEVGDAFDLEADVRGSGSVSIPGLGVRWASTDPLIAKVEGGRVEALQPGSVSISAVVGNVANSILLKVNDPVPAEVRISPGSVRIHEGGRFDLSAQVLDRRGRELERDIQWGTSDSAVATVTQEGEVIAAGGGSVTVTAESEGATGTAEVVVEGAPVVVGAPVREKPAGAAKPRARPTPTLVRPWYRKPLWIAASVVGVLGLSTIGLMSVLGPDDPAPNPTGDDPVQTATGDDLAPAPTRPDSVLLSLPVDTLTVGDSVRLRASALNAEGQPLAGLAVLWESRANDVAVVDSLGWVTAQSEGSVEVAATIEGVEATATLTVRPAPLQTAAVEEEDPAETPLPAVTTDTPTQPVQEEAQDSAEADPPPPTPRAPTPAMLEIELPAPSMLVGETQDAIARVFDSRRAPVSPGTYTLSWQSSDPDVISVNRQTGEVSAGGAGSAWLVAAAGDARDSVSITTAVPIAAVAVDGSDFDMEIGTSRVLSASVLGPSQQPIDRAVTWTSSEPGVATIDAGTGQVTSITAGVAEITASVEDFADGVTVTVAEPAPSLPSPETVQSAVESYVAGLGQGDRDAVTSYWGTGDEDARDDLLDRMGNLEFAAELGPVEAAVLSDDVVTVSFQVSTTYRTNFGSDREEDWTFQARFALVGAEWQLTSCVLQP